MNAYNKLFARLDTKTRQPILEKVRNSHSARQHILLVDDDTLFCKVTSDALSEAGFEVSIVSDGNCALSLISSQPGKFDLIILDRMMPELSGIEVLGKLSAQKLKSNIPVIMLTSYAGKSQIEIASQYGVTETIFKTIGNADLINVVNRTLKNKEINFSLIVD